MQRSPLVNSNSLDPGVIYYSSQKSPIDVYAIGVFVVFPERRFLNPPKRNPGFRVWRGSVVWGTVPIIIIIIIFIIITITVVIIMMITTIIITTYLSLSIYIYTYTRI